MYFQKNLVLAAWFPNWSGLAKRDCGELSRQTQPKALDIKGQVRIHELWREVSGHHLLLHHWVRERALIIVM